MNQEVAHEIIRVGERDFALIYPLVLSNCNHSMHVMTEELFAPIIPVKKITNHEEALLLAKDSPYGLSASVWMDQSSEKDVNFKKLLSFLFGKIYLDGSPVSPQYHALHATGGFKNSRVIINPGDDGLIKMPWEDKYNPFEHISPSVTDQLGRHGPRHTYMDITK